MACVLKKRKRCLKSVTPTYLKVYEGEVYELRPEESVNPVAGHSKTISHVVIGLRTTKGTQQLKLDPTIYTALQKERVSCGDVIYIEANSGAVKRLHVPFLLLTF